MTKLEHVAVGTVTCGVIVGASRMPMDANVAFLAIGGIVGSLLPNIDHFFARIGFVLAGKQERYYKRMMLHDPLFHIIFGVLLMVLLKTGVIANWFGDTVFNIFDPQRFSEFAAELTAKGFGYILGGIYVGIFMHLFMDALTIEGLPIAYPLNRKYYLHLLPKDREKKSWHIRDDGTTYVAVDSRSWRLSYGSYKTATIVACVTLIGIGILSAITGLNGIFVMLSNILRVSFI